MHCLTVFTFFLKDVTNAEYMISGSLVALKSTLLIPNNLSAYEVNLDSRIMNKILYVFDKHGILLFLLQSVLSSLHIGKMISSFHS
jgi:hypothetical protein